MTATVVLDEWERQHATHVGYLRQLSNLGRADAYGFDADGWGAHIEGATAEYAVAKHYDLPWSGVVKNPWKLQGDVGELQVRSTKVYGNRLITHPKDGDDDWFIFVVSSSDLLSHELMGCMKGGVSKFKDWWEDPTGKRPAYFVPNKSLYPLETYESLWMRTPVAV